MFSLWDESKKFTNLKLKDKPSPANSKPNLFHTYKENTKAYPMHGLYDDRRNVSGSKFSVAAFSPFCTNNI